LQGSGKTTTAGKLALHLKNLDKSPLLCSLDLKRLAAGEQLEIIARETGVNYFTSSSRELPLLIRELKKNASDYGYDFVIVDTAGRLHIDDELMEELRLVKAMLHPAEVIFVADALTGQDAVNSALSFSEKIGIDSIILTKLDADARGGAALSIVSVTGKPIKFIGNGEKLVDLEKFHPERLAAKILGMGDMLTLIEKAEKNFDQQQAEVLSRRMLANEFSLNDFLSQLKQIGKLGSMNDIMGMLPNLGFKGNMADVHFDEKRLRRLAAVIESMTGKERDNPKIIDGRRRLRISRGSGRPVSEVNQVLKSYAEMKKNFKKPFFRKMLKKFDNFSKMM
jgi:signal recognition particle subunit SRP54